MPLLSFGMVSLWRSVPQIKSVQAVRYVEKKAGGILIRTVCSKYRILGKMLIFIMAALPNQ